MTIICAASAGVHAALAPEHFREVPVLGLGFGGAAATLAVVAVALDRRPRSRSVLRAAALVLSVLLIGYVATRIAAVPLLGGHREPVDALGAATKLIEALGLTLAIKPTNEHVASPQLMVATEKGVLS